MRLRRRADRDGDDGRSRLVDAARTGDEVALAVLRAGLDPRTVARLAALLPPAAPDALAVLGAARACTDGPVRAQVVLVLLDGGRRSPALVAELLDLPLDAVLEAHRSALTGDGAAAAAPGCRGWVLVGRPDGAGVTPDEQQAAAAHLAACRRCTAARAAATQAARRAVVPGPRLPVTAPAPAGEP